MRFTPVELIHKKKMGQKHSAAEIRYLVQNYVKGKIPDYQMAAWLMAVYFQEMTTAETHFLTQAILKSGRTMDFSDLAAPKIDKHSTGGVGDKTSLVLAPIVAAAGVAVPMISGRGLGHTGGTLDKLESIPGLTTQLSEERFQELVKEHLLCYIGQTQNICPADRLMYALRDVTATVDSLPLICASIMSKKLAEGIDGLVLDVKFGSGAFMKSQSQAEKLAAALIAIGKKAGKKVHALLTNMEQPLGRFIGNALEVQECLAILKGENLAPFVEETQQLSVDLATEMLLLGEAKSRGQAKEQVQKLLSSGEAFEKFAAVCQAQGGNLHDLPKARYQHQVVAPHQGFLSRLDTEKIGYAAVVLGAGRLQTTDKIDPTAGIEIHSKLGDKVAKGQVLFTLYANNKSVLPQAEKRLMQSFELTEEKPTPLGPLVANIIES